MKQPIHVKHHVQIKQCETKLKWTNMHTIQHTLTFIINKSRMFP